MPGPDPTQGMMPSLLDRLIDPESGGTAAMVGYRPEQLVDAVHRDLDELLNTRRSVTEVPPWFPETANSIVIYGLPDLVGVKAVTVEQRAELGRVLEEIVRQFEPRLRDVKATLLATDKDEYQRQVRFRIEARLRVDPAPEVNFDTILELTTGHAAVERSGT